LSRYVSDAVIRRLPGYYRHLRELEAAGVAHISSQQLGRRMQCTASQIRQDISSFGSFGRQGYGYDVTDLKNHIAQILGIDQEHHLVIIGAGNIGRAIASYPAFLQSGFTAAGIFDADPSKVGQTVGGLTVMNISELASFSKNKKIDIGVLAVPASAAQKALDLLVSNGILAIWNFAPTDLVYGSNVTLVNVHLSESLQVLSYRMKNAD
jgi:redox-sensing transcriptional repressor